MSLPTQYQHAQGARGGPSTLMGGPSQIQLRLNSNLHRENKKLLHLPSMVQGMGGSCSTGSPPPPSPHPPPSPPPAPSAVPSALLPDPTFVDRQKNNQTCISCLVYFGSCFLSCK